MYKEHKVESVDGKHKWLIEDMERECNVFVQTRPGVYEYAYHSDMCFIATVYDIHCRIAEVKGLTWKSFAELERA